MKCSLYVFLIFILFISVAARAQPPEWLVSHMEHMAQGSGIWVADNTESKDLSGIHETRSFDINEMGEWIERRFYCWKLKES